MSRTLANQVSPSMQALWGAGAPGLALVLEMIAVLPVLSTPVQVDDVEAHTAERHPRQGFPESVDTDIKEEESHETGRAVTLLNINSRHKNGDLAPSLVLSDSDGGALAERLEQHLDRKDEGYRRREVGLEDETDLLVRKLEDKELVRQHGLRRLSQTMSSGGEAGGEQGQERPSSSQESSESSDSSVETAQEAARPLTLPGLLYTDQELGSAPVLFSERHPLIKSSEVQEPPDIQPLAFSFPSLSSSGLTMLYGCRVCPWHCSSILSLEEWLEHR